MNSPTIKTTTSYQSFQSNTKTTNIPISSVPQQPITTLTSNQQTTTTLTSNQQSTTVSPIQQPTTTISTQQADSQPIVSKQTSSNTYKPNISSVTSPKQVNTGQKVGTGVNKMGYQKSVTSVTSPTGKTQMRSSGPSTGIVSSKFISSKKY